MSGDLFSNLTQLVGTSNPILARCIIDIVGPNFP